jgi:hypothetical protein
MRISSRTLKNRNPLNRLAQTIKHFPIKCPTSLQIKIRVITGITVARFSFMAGLGSWTKPRLKEDRVGGESDPEEDNCGGEKALVR